jgi:hypothetical protein
MAMGTCGVDGEEQLGLKFYELVYPLLPGGFEYSFVSTSFRPVVDRKTDISIFKKMLAPKREDA